MYSAAGDATVEESRVDLDRPIRHLPEFLAAQAAAEVPRHSHPPASTAI
jgi:hypothetical protein